MSRSEEEEMSNGSLIKMSCFDSKFSHLENISTYFYDGILNEEVLRISLIETVKKIPILSSVIVSKVEDDGRGSESLYFRLVKPSNVEILRKEINVDEDYIYNLGEPSKETGIIPFDECKELNRYIGHVQIPKEPEEMPCITNTPLLVITHLVLVNTKRSIISVATSHSLVDLLSHIQFLKIWEYFYNKIIDSHDSHVFDIHSSDIYENYPFKKYTFDRLPLFPSQDFQNTPPSRFLLEKYVRSDDSHSKKKIYILKEVVFTYKRLEELKKYALETVSKDIQKKNDQYKEEYFHFSSHDVISAFLWKLFCPIRDDDTTMEDVFPIQVHINFRNRMEGINDTFFGNAVHTANTVLSRKEVNGISFGDLAFLIRKMIKEYSEEDVKKVIDGMHRKRISDKKKKKKKKKKYDWNNGIYLNDWRLLRKVVPKFKLVRCERYVMVPSLEVQPGFRFYVHHHSEGIAVFTPIEESIYDRIKDLNLSSLQTIEKFSSIFCFL